jgi:hypothetical protein
MKHRIAILSVTVAVVAVSCGGADSPDAPTNSPAAEPQTSVTTTSAATTTSVVVAAAAAGGDTEFCELMSAQDTATQTMDIFDPASVERANREALDAIERARDLVPGDIRSEFDTLASAFESLVMALEEIGWDMTAIDETDPRILRMGSPEVLAAADALTNYCGLDGGADAGATDQSPDAAAASDTGLPDDLVAPGATFTGEGPSGIKFFTSSASFDETVAYYEGVLGEGPVNVGGAAGYRIASFLADTPDDVLVQIQEGDAELLITITLTG